MKILILSCNTGGGHNSAGAALRESITRLGHEALMVNALEFLPHGASEILSRGHNFLYRHTPWLFGVGYRYEEKHQPVLIYEQNAKAAPDLLALLEREQPDAILCVHVFTGMMMTELRHNYGVTTPTYFVATDYTCSPGTGDIDVDGFCIPHADLMDEYEGCGCDRAKLIPTGIPVRQAFRDNMSRADARKALELTDARKVYLLACGSMGAGPMRDVARCIRSLLGEGDMLVAVCGNNKRLQKQLEEDFWYYPQQVRVLGFTQEMALYMHAADLLITKAGGLTTAEAVAAEVPLLYLDAVPGCETRNLEFMVGRGFCLAVGSDEDLPPLMKGIAGGAIDPETMVHRRRISFPRHAADTIAALVCGEDAE